MGSTNDNITQALTRLFERHRIIFWHDAKQELREEFEALSLDGVEKLELDNNEFGIKYRILREQPTQKFLLYRSGSQPLDLENWLLDVQLAHGEFRSDQGAIWLAELELGSEFTEIMREHAEFFRAGKRRSALKKLLNPDDNAGQVRFKMLAACAGSEPRMDAVLENLLQELAGGDDDRSKLLGRCNLGEFFH
ncbi:MAG: BREX-1 system phosphatase PglZ type A, partial [Gammaproteobacteria bacterium]|nr:BREX-1 system phosphatase PglZ type A [Gammaproteobacteria bacterium]